MSMGARVRELTTDQLDQTLPFQRKLVSYFNIEFLLGGPQMNFTYKLRILDLCILGTEGIVSRFRYYSY
jgi:hypothetical protein